MDIQPQIKLGFHGVDFVNVQFTSSEIFTGKENEGIDIDISPKVFYPADNNKQFKIIMEINLKSKGYFTLGLFAVGSFEFEKNEIIGEIKKDFINTNAPAIMFPYVRAFISSFTSLLGNGIITLTIPPQFFSGALEELKDSPLIDEGEE